jgi:hypothetical protein
MVDLVSEDRSGKLEFPEPYTPNKSGTIPHIISTIVYEYIYLNPVICIIGFGLKKTSLKKVEKLNGLLPLF